VYSVGGISHEIDILRKIKENTTGKTSISAKDNG
jgi:hypothetical protein